MCKKFMKRALELAKEFEGRTTPNPMVGAVLVKDGVIIGEAAHHKAGEPHAEVNAINSATCSPSGSTLYVTLEPCSHYGKTPPCADLIIKSEIAEVYVAMTDPNPLVNGKGIKKMQDAGIVVHVGLLESEAEQLNEVFIHNVTKKRAHFALKTAISLDGKIATSGMDSKWITCEASRKETHRLRSIYDAILVGKNTFIKDNPSLNIRFDYQVMKEPDKIILVDKWEWEKDVIVSSNAYQTLSTNKLYFAVPLSEIEKARSITKLIDKVDIIPFNSFSDLPEILYDIGVMSVFIEGGSGVYNSSVKVGMINKYYLFNAPILLGNEGIGWSGNLGIATVKDSIRLKIAKVIRFDTDTLTILYPEEN